MEQHTGTAGFETIAQLLLEQKKRMEQLEAEIRELRGQLAALQRGEDIVVAIKGKQIRLAVTDSQTSSQESDASSAKERRSSRLPDGEREHSANSSSLASSLTL